MASAISHFIVAAALALPVAESRAPRRVLPPWGISVSCGLLAVAPDLDTFAMRAFDIPYRSFFGHRGFFHSPFFLILLSTLMAAIVARRQTRSTRFLLALVWAGAAITHPLLDMLTDGGAGVMLFFPLSEARVFFPWQPIHVSPLDISSFFSQAGDILLSEFPFCAAAVLIGLSGRVLASRSRSFRKEF